MLIHFLTNILKVLSHRQEFHTIPEVHGDKNKTGDNATYTELTEVNEFSLSQLISLNDSTTKGTGNEQVQVCCIVD